MRKITFIITTFIFAFCGLFLSQTVRADDTTTKPFTDNEILGVGSYLMHLRPEP